MKLSLICVDNCRSAIKPTKRQALPRSTLILNYNEDSADFEATATGEENDCKIAS